MKLCMEATNAAHGVFALKEIHPKEIKALEAIIDDERIRIEAMPNMYPMGCLLYTSRCV